MIGTHNSLTFSKPLHWWFRPFSFMWRCQDINLEEQIERGVNFFDIRIRFSIKKSMYMIRYCHGMVDLDYNIDLESLLHFLKSKNCKCRIILEHIAELNPSEDYNYNCHLNYCELINIITNTDKDFLNLGVITEIIIKKNWDVLYDSDLTVCDMSYVPFYSDKSFWWNIKHMKLSTIKRWAKNHNNGYTHDMVLNNKYVYMYDYINVVK